MNKAVTLLELLVVIIIIGVLATLGFTHYGGQRELTYDREAQANLKLIIAAEKIFRIESPAEDYYISNVISNINANLKLMLPAGADRIWNYSVSAKNGTNPKTCCAQATRRNAEARTFRMRNSETEAVADACP